MIKSKQKIEEAGLVDYYIFIHFTLYWYNFHRVDVHIKEDAFYSHLSFLLVVWCVTDIITHNIINLMPDAASNISFDFNSP